MDDPIATALREAQRELRKVVATNKARKTRLISIACDRLGYQEYLEVRDSIDKNITALYHKLQRKDVPKVLKKKKKTLQGLAGGAGAGEDTGPGLLPQCPAALGLMQDDENHLSVNEQLKQLVETRRQWVDSVGAVFDAKEREIPGRLYGLPKRSVFEGIEEELQAMLAAPLVDVNGFNSTINGTMASSSDNGRNQSGSSKINSNSHGGVNGKGKERARSDAMDIG